MPSRTTKITTTTKVTITLTDHSVRSPAPYSTNYSELATRGFAISSTR